MMERLGGAEAFPLLWSNLSRIRIRHARPELKGVPPKLPPAIPLSIVFAGDEWKDAAPRKEPCLIGDKAPAFRSDWKSEWDTAKKYFGHCIVHKELRVRTQIDADKRRALDQNLFAYESLDPAGLEWRTALDLHYVPASQRAGICDELKTLLSYGIFGMGKTKARMDSQICNPISPRFASSTAAGPSLVIQLQTPALLGLPAEWQTARSAADVHRIYSRAWRELSSKAPLTLSHYFAEQELAGGLYLHRRFRPAGSAYQPWLLTSAGSVFVFEGSDRPEVRQLLDDWLRTGLPIAPSLREHYKLQGGDFDLWNQCPFVPENGFGELAVNLQLNWKDRLLEVDHD